MKKILLLIIYTFFFSNVFSEKVDVKTAQNVALNFYNSQVLKKSGLKSTAIIQISIAETVYIESKLKTSTIDEEKTALYYIFNLQDNNGFVIISADDNVKPILGYSNQGNYDNTISQPPAYLEMMENFKKQIENVINNNIINADTKKEWEEYNTSSTRTKSSSYVEPLIKTKWGQGNGYNNDCPSDSEGSHVPVGCVATAMAQIMKYHNYPEQGIGQHSYIHPTYGEQKADFGNTFYDWENMPLYEGNSNIAELMYHCGVSVDMNYAIGGSGAQSHKVASSLVDYFNYTSTIEFITKSNFTAAEWVSVLKKDLNNAMPIYYDGYRTTPSVVGHAFICDGYDSNGYFHFNWGWGGSVDGYFLFDQSWSEYQHAIIGIRPKITEPISINIQDSLALVALYDSCGGVDWLNKTNWLTGNVESWYGVSVGNGLKDTEINGRIIELKMNDNNLSGSLPSKIKDLTKISYLNLSNNNINGNIPTQVGNLSNLTDLILSNNLLTGEIPKEFGDLSQLINLDLRDNQLSGTIPCDFGNLSNLVGLLLSDNQLSGSIPIELENLTLLRSLDLRINQLSGSIPPEFGHLSGLRVLKLSNNQLSGSIPAGFENLSNLVQLILSDNQLSGSIPSELGSLSNLESLSLSNNKLNDSIPSELGNLTNLNYLYLNNNRLSGSIPSQLNNLSNLVKLDLNDNELSGLTNLSGLDELKEFRVFSNSLTFRDLDSVNLGSVDMYYSPQDTLSLNRIFVALDEGESFDSKSVLNNCDELIRENNLYSAYRNNILVYGPAEEQYTIPSYTNDLNGNYSFSISNSDYPNLTLYSDRLVIKTSSFENDSLALVTIYNKCNGANWTNNTNWLAGNLEDWYGVTVNNNRVSSLDLENNNLVGNIPPEVGNLKGLLQLRLYGNQLRGFIPSELGNLTRLEYLNLQGNRLNSTIPSEFGNLSSLVELDLSENQLYGFIPSDLGNLSSLDKLELSNNQLSGYIPSELGSLSQLVHLVLNFNKLSGDVPRELGNLSELEELQLSNNQLNGSIFSEIGNLIKLKSLNLQSNHLSGLVPTELGNLSNLVELKLSDNQLSGSIPSELGNLIRLTYLNLGNNKLNGSIPSELENLTKLEYLILNKNEFSELINLSGLYELKELNIHSNALTFNDLDSVNLVSGDMYYSPQDTFLLSKMFVALDEGESFDSKSVLNNFDELIREDNMYSAYRNNKLIYGPETEQYTIASYSNDLSGSYSFSISNSDYPNLTLYSNNLEIKTSSFENDSLALVALYNECNGVNWNKNTNWITGNVEDWYGVTMNNNRVSSLDLANNNLEGSLPSEFGNLYKLEYLYLNDNELTDLANLSDFNALKEINISSNLLTFNDLDRLNLVSGDMDYSPQDTLSLNKMFVALNEGESFGFKSVLNNFDELVRENNMYSAYKDNVLVYGPVAEQYAISAYTNDLCGSYSFSISNSDYPNLILYSDTLEIKTSSFENDSLALVVFYNQCNGPNWKNNTNWLTGNVEDWDGVTVKNNRVCKLQKGWDYQLSGSIPSQLGNLTELEVLSLYQSSLSGSIPPELGNLTKLEILELGSYLSGSIPPELGNLTNLWKLSLGSNLSGSIPPELGNLSNLLELNLGYNQLSGSIPSELGNLSNLYSLYLGNNQISGSIPSEFGNLSNLRIIFLDNNQLSGSIPSEMENLYNLTTLILHNNQLSGSIPSEFGNLLKLGWLKLSNNHLSGSIPSELGNLFNLNRLELSNNQLSGSIPSQLGDISNLEKINVSDNELSGLTNLSRLFILEELDVHSNSLTFSDLDSLNLVSENIRYNLQDTLSLDRMFVALYEGESFDFLSVVNGRDELMGENNMYSVYKNDVLVYGPIAEQYTISSYTSDMSGIYSISINNSDYPDLTLYSDKLVIKSPSLESDSLALVAIYNECNGSNWINNTNWLTANVKDWYGVSVTENRVSKLDLSNNNLERLLPVEIRYLTELNYLFLGSNNLSGPVLSELGKLKNLIILDLSDNLLSGEIPSQLGTLGQIEKIYLANNQFSGDMPSELSNLTSLSLLYLNNNQLSGSIPSGLGNMAQLEYLNLSVNNFSKLADLSGLNILKELDVSSNSFTFEDLESTKLNLEGKIYAPQNTLALTSEDARLNIGLAFSFSDYLSDKESFINANNQYSIFKDGQLIYGPVNDFALSITSLSLDDKGKYNLEITNSTLPELKLISDTLKLDVNINPNQPILLSPNNFEKGVLLEPILTWSCTDLDGDGALNYSVFFDKGNGLEMIGETNNTYFNFSNSVVKLEYEVDYSWAVVANDGGLNSGQSEVWAFTTMQVNHTPTAIELSSNLISEDKEIGSIVGELSTTDDIGDSHKYSLEEGVNLDNHFFEITDNSLKTKQSLDYESQTEHKIKIRSTDNEGLYINEEFVIHIEDVIETGIESLETLGLYLHPNPVKDYLTVSSSETNSVLIQVLGAGGEVVFSEEWESPFTNRINFSNYSNGLYLLRFIIDGKVVTHKIMLVK